MRKTIELEVVRRDLDRVIEGVAEHGDRVVVDRNRDDRRFPGGSLGERP